MSQIPEIQKPWQHGAMLWLLANVIGTVFLGLYLLTKGDKIFVPALIIGFFAAGISLPIIPISVPLFSRVLGVGNRDERVCLALLAVTELFIVSIGLVAVVNREFNLPAQTIVRLMAPFYPAAILATSLEYQKWLFRSDDQLIGAQPFGI